MPALIDFEHRSFTTDFSTLLRIEGGYWSKNEAWQELIERGATKAKKVSDFQFSFRDNDLLIGNHCCSEAVFSNPMRDLAEYKKWKDGIRKFPFSGQYLKLDIKKQEQKKPSEAITGALGEIVAGLMFNARAVILVRPIQRYPDFIGKLRNGHGWAYLESKCTGTPLSQGYLDKRVPKTEYKDICVSAAEEIKNNRSLTVYGSFIQIKNYSPIELKQTIVEISDTNKPTTPGMKLKIPKIYILKAVKHCIEQALESLNEDLSKVFERTNTFDLEKCNLMIKNAATEKIADFERIANLTEGEIQEDDLTQQILAEECAKKAEELRTSFTSASTGFLLDFTQLPKNPTPRKMEKTLQIDSRRAIYVQPIDRSDFQNVNAAVDNEDWKITTFRKGTTEVYAIGNTYVAIGDAAQGPRPIAGFDSRDWKKR